jgi:hypothetical protein
MTFQQQLKRSRELKPLIDYLFYHYDRDWTEFAKNNIPCEDHWIAQVLNHAALAWHLKRWCQLNGKGAPPR